MSQTNKRSFTKLGGELWYDDIVVIIVYFAEAATY